MHASTTVAQVLRSKGSQIFSVAPDDTVLRALEVMADRNVGALLVLERGRLAGILSERDYARKVILEGRASRDTLVREVMTSELVTVRPSVSVTQCMELMTDHRIRHLPVVDDGGALQGVLSVGDVVKATIAEQATLIEQLESYIRGAG
ncbi:MAG: CBS domain-containing protein [Trueperaceae bacterium]